LARNALNDDGLMAQWVYGRSETEYKLIMRTFLTVFPNATLWGSDLLVGSKSPLHLERAAFERKLQDPAMRAVLESVGLGSFEALLSRYRAGPDELTQFLGPGPILTDDRPMVEYFLSLPSGERAVDLSGLRGDPRRLVYP
jgi:spermidine synthase